MKALVFELCGGNDVVKRDGYFICQNCGTKYSLEEAKKIILEGKVDVSGSTIKVDESESIERNLLIARRAIQKKDWKEAEEYYSNVEQYDPTNTEAFLYCSFAKVWIAIDTKEQKSISDSFYVLGRTLSILNENFDAKKTDEYIPLLERFVDEIINASNIAMVYRTYNDLVIIDAVSTFHEGYIDVLVKIAEKIPEDKTEAIISTYKQAIKSGEWLLERIQFANAETIRQTIIDCHEQIKRINPSYDIPEPPEAKVSQEKSGCYVATAVYGSYDCPQVWTLRRFRDNMLAQKWYGRAFIHTYYTISPTLVRWFGASIWFKNMWKPKLDRMVNNLREQGVEDTPYNDKRW